MYYSSVKAMPERAELAAICDIRPEALELRQREWSVPGFSTMEEMLCKVDVDALCLLLPHDVHRDCVEAAARFHKHVYLEKPIANSREEARKIAAVVEQSGITLLVGHTGLFNPSFQRVLEFIKKGWLGRPLFARGTSAGWLSFRPWDFRLNKQQTGGGCWVDAGGHLVYCLREIFGEVDLVTGVTGRLARTEM
jgi:predicted dehydrogenase